MTLISSSLLLVLPLHHLDIYPGALLANCARRRPFGGLLWLLRRDLPFSAREASLFGRCRLALILAGRLIGSMMVVPDHGRSVSAHLWHAIAYPLGWLIAVCLH